MTTAAWKVAAVIGGVAIAAAMALVAWPHVRGARDVRDARSAQAVAQDEAGSIATPADVTLGAYLARAGNCEGCHTERGGRPYAGGRGISTPFGTVHSSNLTPDVTTGIGAWSQGDFWRALHHGQSKDGRLLYPAFPYPEYTLVTRQDADAILAFLRTQPAVTQANKAHQLRFPYNTQAALAAWRILFFKPGVFEPDAKQSAHWNRGAYLVRGLGHCQACHAPRNGLGATSGDVELSGGLIPMQGWYAPSLAASSEAGVADWPTQDVVDLLKTGKSARGSAMGPMAQVVWRSTQHLSQDDLHSMAVFLQQLPPQLPPQLRQTVAEPAPSSKADSSLLARGAIIYRDQCSACHGEQGQGAGRAYAPLAGNRSVTMASPANLVRVIVSGGFLPATAGNPRPFGMPPFGHTLSDADIAAVATFVRQAWGNSAAPVPVLAVMRGR